MLLNGPCLQTFSRAFLVLLFNFIICPLVQRKTLRKIQNQLKGPIQMDFIFFFFLTVRIKSSFLISSLRYGLQQLAHALSHQNYRIISKLLLEIVYSYKAHGNNIKCRIYSWCESRTGFEGQCFDSYRALTWGRTSKTSL